MESAPDTENVAYMDEYPHITERLRLKRLARPAVSNVVSLRNVLPFIHPSEYEITPEEKI